MIRALLAGKKTQTRRLATSPLAKTQTGDLLWVRELWRTTKKMDPHSPKRIEFLCREAGYKNTWAPILCCATPGERLNWRAEDEIGRVRAAMHMPLWASRLTLAATEVRMQELWDITDSDALAEGFATRRAFFDTIDKLHGGVVTGDTKMVAITFKLHRRNVRTLRKN